MKIALVSNYASPGGGQCAIGVFTTQIAHYLLNPDNEVYIIGFSQYHKFDYFWDYYRVKYQEVKPLPQPSNHGDPKKINFFIHQFLEKYILSNKVNRLVKKYKIDLIESYDLDGPLWFAPNIPKVIRIHGSHTAHSYFENLQPDRLVKFYERRNLSFSNNLIAVSDHIGKVTLQAFNMKDKAYQVIHYGVIGDHIINSPAKRNEAEILFIGKVNKRKGIFQLFRAFSLVWEKIPEAKLKIVGPFDNPDQRWELMTQLKNLLPEQAQINVNFLNHKGHHRLIGFYCEATVTVFPSLVEAFGMTRIEAMACGSPVILSKGLSGPEIVEDGISGILVDVYNPTELADAIIRVIKDKELQARLGKDARIQAQDKFNMSLIAKQTKEFYNKVMENHRK